MPFVQPSLKIIKMQSCANGHHDTAILLCKWNSNALEVKNYKKQTPVDVALENG